MRKIGCLLVLQVGVGALLACGGAAPAGPDKIGAWAACETFVEKRLKAPSTADFQSYRDELVDASGGDHFRVHGYVDAQNALGAKLRSNWSCEVHATQGSWLLDSINIE